MALHDKQLVAEGRVLVTKNGRPLHVQETSLMAICGQPIGLLWRRQEGPVARYRLCERCELALRELEDGEPVT